MCFTLLLSHLLQSGSEPGLSLSLRVGLCLSLACQPVTSLNYCDLQVNSRDVEHKQYVLEN